MRKSRLILCKPPIFKVETFKNIYLHSSSVPQITFCDFYIKQVKRGPFWLMGKTSITYLLFALLPKVNSMDFGIHRPGLGVFPTAPFYSKILELCVLARMRTHRLGDPE